MKLSIVIPLYNKEKFIERCLKSLLDQDLSKNEYEIIIVDDESTDSSYEIAKKLSESKSNINLYRQRNGGAGAARNKGLKVSKGNYVYFLDADDYIASNVLGQILKIVESNNLEILGFNTKYTNGGSQTKSETQDVENPYVEVMDGMKFIANRSFRNEAWWYIIKKSFLLDTGITFTEGRFLQDSIFTATLLLKTKRVAKVSLDIHRFVQVENSATTNRNHKHILKFIDDLVYAIDKFDVLLNGLDSSHEAYNKVFNVYRRKQQSFVFTLFIKSFRCNSLSLDELSNILKKLRVLKVYPINRKLGGIGNRKTKRLYDLVHIPIFNNRFLLFFSLKVKRFLSPT